MVIHPLPIESYSSRTNVTNSFNSVISDSVKRLALGTVQFGLTYGVANTQGKVSLEQARVMLEMVRVAGIDTLDTAIAYGEAESVLGQIGVSDFRLISKLPALPECVGRVDDWVVAQVENSLKRLRVPFLGGLMLHAPDDLLGRHGLALARGLERVRVAGLVKSLGLSVYSPEQLSKLVDRFQLDIVQIPVNIFDRRFIETGWLDCLVKNGVEVHARSVFLQGLLLMARNRVPSMFAPFRPLIDDWHAWLSEEENSGRSSLQVCLAHVASYTGITRIVIGADSSKQLQEIISAAAVEPKLAPISLINHTSTLINPSLWKTL